MRSDPCVARWRPAPYPLPVAPDGSAGVAVADPLVPFYTPPCARYVGLDGKGAWYRLPAVPDIPWADA